MPDDDFAEIIAASEKAAIERRERFRADQTVAMKPIVTFLESLAAGGLVRQVDQKFEYGDKLEIMAYVLSCNRFLVIRCIGIPPEQELGGAIAWRARAEILTVFPRFEADVVTMPQGQLDEAGNAFLREIAQQIGSSRGAAVKLPKRGSGSEEAP